MKIISYLLLALFLAVAGLAAVYYVKSKHQETIIDKMAVDVRAARDSLSSIKTSVEASDRIIGNLHDALSQISEQRNVVTERVIMLEKTNAEIRDLLATRLPPSGCLLDDTCNAPQVRTAEPGPVAPVHTTYPQKERGSARSGDEQ